MGTLIRETFMRETRERGGRWRERREIGGRYVGDRRGESAGREMGDGREREEKIVENREAERQRDEIVFMSCGCLYCVIVVTSKKR